MISDVIGFLFLGSSNVVFQIVCPKDTNQYNQAKEIIGNEILTHSSMPWTTFWEVQTLHAVTIVSLSQWISS